MGFFLKIKVGHMLCEPPMGRDPPVEKHRSRTVLRKWRYALIPQGYFEGSQDGKGEKGGESDKKNLNVVRNGWDLRAQDFGSGHKK